MSRLEPTIIRANAGTGKTFTLSNRYLSLLFLHEKPERILATTFTRKAAGEIQARIFTRLASAAGSDKAAARLGAELNLPVTQKRAMELLRSLVESQHRLAIGTLDSLCQRLLKMFAIEAGFPHGFRPASEEENANLITSAISGLIGRNKTERLFVLLRLLAGGKDRYGIHNALEKALRENHQLFLQSSKEAWGTIAALPEASAEDLRAALEAIPNLPPVLNQGDKKPSGIYVNGMAGDLERAKSGDWSGFLKAGIAKAIFQRLKTFGRQEIPASFLAAYAPLVSHAAAMVLNERLKRLEALYALLSEYDAEYWAERRGSGVLDFGDIKQLLSTAAVFGNLEELYFRLDSEFPHILLDEFQDTSLVEWEIVKPIAAEILSKASGTDNTFFCVGDVKQAIYGWRGGVAEIFDSIAEEWPHIVADELPLSYRSAPEIISFVNTIFSGVESSEPLADYAEVAARWKRGFTEHGAAKKDLPGFVSVEAIPAADDDGPELVARAAQLAQSIQRSNPAVTIGILTRKNDDVRAVIRKLDDLGIPASEEGGVTLSDSKAVLAFIALFNLVDHPGDRISQFHVENSPLAAALAETLGSPYIRRAPVAALRARLLSDGFGKVILSLLHAGGDAWSETDISRVRQLAELGFAFDERRGIRAREFVKFVERKKVEQARPSSIRVMTYHKSKGLEFDAVILAFQHQPWSGKGQRGPSVLALRSSPAKRPQQVVPSLAQALVGVHPAIQAAAKQAKDSQVVDALNLLYVALTRPRQALYLLLPAVSDAAKKKMPLSGAAIMRAALALSDDTRTGEIFRAGDSTWMRSVEPAGDPLVSSDPIPEKISLQKPKAAIRSTTFLTASAAEGEGIERVADSLFGAGAAMDEGSMYHKLFETLEWIDAEVKFDASAALRSFRISPAEVSRLEKVCKKMLDSANLRQYLCRAHFEQRGASAELYRELPFVESEGDTLVRGVIDRIVVERHDGAVTAVTVFDFKTDRVEGEEVAKRAEFYRPQLKVYVKAAARIFGVPPKSVKPVLLFMRAGVAFEL